jgi:hypothetical protein
MYTYRFEKYVLRMLIGSNEEEAAGRLGISAETAADRATAEQQLAELRTRTESRGLDFSKFWTTYDNWKTGILNYFDERYTSAAVEGINNKARVITKRCYGVKSSETLRNRLILDLNRASEAVGRSIAELREIVSRLKAVFLGFCT